MVIDLYPRLSRIKYHLMYRNEPRRASLSEARASALWPTPNWKPQPGCCYLWKEIDVLMWVNFCPLPLPSAPFTNCVCSGNNPITTNFLMFLPTTNQLRDTKMRNTRVRATKMRNDLFIFIYRFCYCSNIITMWNVNNNSLLSRHWQ